MNMNIIILPHGWVVVGDYWSEGSRAGIHEGATIRRWGTDAGLGQLARHGPTKKTRLDRDTPSSWNKLAEIKVMGVFPDAAVLLEALWLAPPLPRAEE